MRIRWRGFELPTRVVKDDSTASANYSKFSAEPFERGFATTIGNSLRRVLLSSIQGAAVRSIRIDGVNNEYTSQEGISGRCRSNHPQHQALAPASAQ